MLTFLGTLIIIVEIISLILKPTIKSTIALNWFNKKRNIQFIIVRIASELKELSLPSTYIESDGKSNNSGTLLESLSRCRAR